MLNCFGVIILLKEKNKIKGNFHKKNQTFGFCSILNEKHLPIKKEGVSQLLRLLGKDRISSDRQDKSPSTDQIIGGIFALKSYN